ncbi:MAG: hypothetical protein Kow0037_11130 [Calditrichia bacterium]
MSFGWTEIIILVAAIHGAVLSVFIWHKRSSIPNPKYLGGLCVSISLILLNMVLGEKIWLEKIPILSLIITPLALVIGPVQYLYIKKLIRQDNQSSEIMLLLHMLPYVLFEIGWICGVFIDGSVNQFINKSISFYFGMLNISISFQALAYVAAILRLIYRTQKLGENGVVSNLAALKWIAYGGAIGWLLFSLENLVFFMGVEYYNQYDYSSIWAAVYVYIFGYWGIMNSSFSVPEIRKTAEKYARSGLSAEKAEEVAREALQTLVEGEYFRQGELSLREFADILKINSHHLSQALNTVFRKNFFEFVNEQRVQYVIKLMKDTEYKNYTLLALGIEAGFNSKSSFITAFKKITGMTPSQYKKKLNISAK